jgi:transcriptional regulator with XRE-family HTH domain
MPSEQKPKKSEFGERLKKLRKQKNLSQQEIGEMTGMHFTNISRYERGLAMPNSGTLKKLSEALEVSGDYLIHGEVEDGARARFEDRELLRQFQTIQKFTDEDKLVVKKLLDAFIFQRQVQGLAGGSVAS